MITVFNCFVNINVIYFVVVFNIVYKYFCIIYRCMESSVEAHSENSVQQLNGDNQKSLQADANNDDVNKNGHSEVMLLIVFFSHVKHLIPY